MRSSQVILAIQLVLAPVAITAQHPVGPEFQVNVSVAGDQGNSAVSPCGESGFTIAWRTLVPGATGSDILARRFSAHGKPLSEEFPVNTYLDDRQSGVSIGSDGSGGLVMVWSSIGSVGTDDDSYSVQGQRFSCDGAPVGSQFQVNTYTGSYQLDPAIAATGGGGFVIVWASDGSSGSDDSLNSVQAQLYGADGLPDGPEFQVNQYTPGYQYIPDVAPDGAGGFVITWTSSSSPPGADDFYGIWARRFKSDGTPAGDEFLVNTTTTSSQFISTVAPTDSGFVITWQSLASAGSDSDGFSIQAQRFTSEGARAGREFQVNSYTESYQIYPEAGGDGSGGFVITWTSDGSAGDDDAWLSIQAQRYGSNGEPIGGEVQVNSYTDGTQEHSMVAPDGAGGFVITWTSLGSSGTDSDEYSVQAQRFGERDIFADGFESGDTLKWSVTIP